MPKQTKFTTGEYVTVFRNKDGQVLFPSAEKSLVVGVRPKSLDVQTLNNEVWKIFPRQLKEPKEGFLRPIDSFLKNLATKMQGYGNDSLFYLSKGWLKEQLGLIKKNYLVEDVYITKKGNLVVETHSLPTYDWDGKPLSHKVGRVIIKIDPGYSSNKGIAVKNLDWQRGNSGHPHIGGTGMGEDAGICFGGAEDYLSSAWSRADIFSVIEIILAMLTQFTADDEEYTDWLESRTKVKGKGREFKEGKARIRWN